MNGSNLPNFISRLFPQKQPAWKRVLHQVDPRELDWRDWMERAEQGASRGLHGAAQGISSAVESGREALDSGLSSAKDRWAEAQDRVHSPDFDAGYKAASEAAKGARASVESAAGSFKEKLPKVRDEWRQSAEDFRGRLPEMPQRFRNGLVPREETFGEKLEGELKERWWLYAGVAVGAVALGSFVAHRRKLAMVPEPPVASGVDLEQYAGRWLELARYPQVYQTGCPSATAEYILQEDGTVKVINLCVDENGEQTRSIEGTAEVVDSISNAKLEVKFDRWWQSFVPSGGKGNYWIHYVSPDYQFAIVGNKDRSSLWILGREAEVSAENWRGLIERVGDLGYDPGKLERDAHTWVKNRVD